jgi:hypothetical protein
MAAWIKLELKHWDNKSKDSAAAFLMAAWFDSRNDQTVFHTLPSSTAHEFTSAMLYASIALPNTQTHAGDSVASALEGGDERTALRTAGISSVTLFASSSAGAEKRSDRIEYANWERYGFPRRGSVRRRFVIDGSD